ncbi:P-loop NTPase fold protein [uncultured Cohaesibacter sp.]|uniref:KAP family P-loop NTPase fold protein n=1 Tax=uncultured Cohaesibacter sp. TaxID=1002546 RepID=UPI002AAB1A4E|nr:P-loop NTPase fold protein [uncultured Cohaesibacter sp.]
MEEQNFKLYETGFDESDFLNRKPLADQLSILLHGSSKPLVVALNGGWGSGKSFFLERWIGEYVNSSEDEESEIAGEVIYFDAFKSDYLDDPLVSLTHTISERLKVTQSKSSTDTASVTEQLKKYAPIVGRAASNVIIAYATRGIYASVEDLFEEPSDNEPSTSPTAMDKASDAAIASTEKLTKEKLDNFSDRFWEAESVRTDAMDQFRMSLKQIVSEKEKLIIVIDELDRCRPDYSLALLEVIKHFFSEKNVHFVLGVNLDELANMVCARYGNNTDGVKYLQKFLSLVITMPYETFIEGETKTLVSKYLASKLLNFNFTENTQKYLKEYFRISQISKNSQPRDIEKILFEMSILPIFFKKEDTKSNNTIYFQIICMGLIILKNTNFKIYQSLHRNNYENIEDLSEIFTTRKPKPKPYRREISEIWNLFLRNDREKTMRTFNILITEDEFPRDFLRNIIKTYLDPFTTTIKLNPN